MRQREAHLLAMQGDEKLPSLKTLQAQQQRLLEEQQRLYDERANRFKKEVKQIETIKSNVDTFLSLLLLTMTVIICAAHSANNLFQKQGISC